MLMGDAGDSKYLMLGKSCPDLFLTMVGKLIVRFRSWGRSSLDQGQPWLGEALTFRYHCNFDKQKDDHIGNESKSNPIMLQ